METGYWKQAKSEVYHTRLDQLLLLILGAIVGYFSEGFSSITVFALIYVVMYAMLVQVLPVGFSMSYINSTFIYYQADRGRKFQL